MNKIAFRISVRANDWTAERAIISSNASERCSDNSELFKYFREFSLTYNSCCLRNISNYTLKCK